MIVVVCVAAYVVALANVATERLRCVIRSEDKQSKK